MKRKLLAAMLVCALIGGQSICASEESSSLEKVISIVKKKIEIPAELSAFSYSSGEDQYNLTWSDDDNMESIDISCESDGDVLAYYYNEYNEDEEESGNTAKSELAEIDDVEAQKVAEDFLKKVIPEYAGFLEKGKHIPTGLGEDYQFEYNFMHDGIKVLQQQVSIGVSKRSGKVTYFNGINYDDKAVYGSKKAAVSLEQAQTLFLSEIGLPLTYQSYYDNEDEQKVFLAYYLEDSEGEAIDAIKGKKVKRFTEEENDDEYAAGMNKTAQDAGMPEKNSVELSPQEQKAVSETAGFLSAESIKKTLESYFPTLKNMKINGSSYSKEENKYIRHVNCEKMKDDGSCAAVYFTCDAKTGELFDYDYDYDPNDEEGADASGKWTQQQALALINKVNPAKGKSIAFDQNGSYEDETTIYYDFNRLYNGIPVYYNGISVTYSKTLKQVVSYYVNWDDELTFPAATGVISKEEVVKNIGLDLYYIETAQHHYSLVYAHENGGNSFDAFTGKMVNYRGKEVADDPEGFYTDMAGHPDEKIIRKLYESGIYFEGTQLHPDEAVTQNEMIRLLCQATYSYEDDESAYEEAINRGIIGKDEKQPDKKIAREEGIKYLISETPYKEAAAMYDLYQYPFDESKVTKELKGYVTLAYGFKIISGEQFDAKKPLTRAEALVMIYHWLEYNV